MAKALFSLGRSTRHTLGRSTRATRSWRSCGTGEARAAGAARAVFRTTSLVRCSCVEMPSSSRLCVKSVLVGVRVSPRRVLVGVDWFNASREVTGARHHRAGALHGRPVHTRRALRERLVVGFRAFRSSTCTTRRFLPEGTVAAAQVHASSLGGLGSRVEEATLPGRRRVSLGRLCALPRGHEFTKVLARRVRHRMCDGQACQSSSKDCSPTSVRWEQQFLDGVSGGARNLGAIVCPDSHLRRFDATTSGAARTKYESVVGPSLDPRKESNMLRSRMPRTTCSRHP